MNASEYKAAIELENRAGFLVAIEAGIMGFLFLVSFTGNVISCVIMHRSARLRTWHNLLLLNVVFVDLLGSVAIVPFAFVVLVTGKWMMGEALCSLAGYMTTALLTVSITTLATISISRYFLITNLLKYMSVFKKKNIMWMLAAIWLFSVLCAFPPIVGWGDFVFLPGNAMCFVYFGSSLSYAAIFTFLVIGLPVATIIACFVKVRQAVKANKRTTETSHSVKSIASEEIDSAKTLFSVVVMVLLCWFPMLLVLLLVASGKEIPRQVALMSTYTVVLPCALKPVIYFCMKKQFRAEFFRLLGKTLPTYQRKTNRIAHNSVAEKTGANGEHGAAQFRVRNQLKSVEFEQNLNSMRI